MEQLYQLSLKKLKIDPAVASGPLISTINEFGWSRSLLWTGVGISDKYTAFESVVNK